MSARDTLKKVAELCDGDLGYFGPDRIQFVFLHPTENVFSIYVLPDGSTAARRAMKDVVEPDNFMKLKLEQVRTTYLLLA